MNSLRALVTRFPRGLYWALVVGGLLVGFHLVDRLGTPIIYRDDFAQDYLLARAILDHQDPYRVPGSTLAARYLPAGEQVVIRHVSLHPPAAALISLPLGLFSYPVARALWLAFEGTLLFAFVRFLPLGANGHPLNSRLGLPVMLLAWPPVAMDLECGQWSILLGTLLALSWLSYRSTRARLGGLLLGLAIAIKVFPVFILLFFAVRRSWRVMAWAVGMATLVTAAPALLVGPAMITRYLLSGPQTTIGWLACFANYSALGAGARFFTSAGDFGGVPPVLTAPALVMPLVAVIVISLLAVIARAVFRRSDPDGAFAIVLCALVLITPLVWQHFLFLLAWPLWLIGHRLAAAGWPRPRTDAFLIAIVLVTIPQQAVSMFAIVASHVWPPAGALILLVLPAGPAITLGLACADVPAPRASDPGWLKRPLPYSRRLSGGTLAS